MMWFDSAPHRAVPLGACLGFAKVESVAAGFQWGVRFLSVMILVLGLIVAALLWQSARGLRAPPGSGYT